MSEPVHLLAAAYALDALDAEERADFEAHLPGCPDCTVEVAQFQATAASALGATAVEPPAAMRQAVLERIAVTEQVPPQPASAGRGARQGGDDRAAQPASADVVQLESRRRRASTILAVAAGVLVVLVATLSVLLVQSRHDQQTQATNAAAVASVISAPDAQSVSGQIAGGGRGAVVMSASRGEAVFLAQGVAPPPNGHVYELWYLAGNGSAMPAGTFSPNANGQVAQLMPARPASASQVGLTVEPGGGSSKPTTTPVLAVPLPPAA
jgi:anti-sigma-K factor RskA